MSDGIDEAAAAFDAVISSSPDRAPRASPPKPDNTGPADVIFKNTGRVEVDDESPAKGGGDEDDVSEAQASAHSRDSRKAKERDRRDDDDEQDGDGADDASRLDDDADESGGPDDESDDAAADEAEEEEAESPETRQFLEQKVEVNVDGEPQEVTVKEALEGYVRTQTFHRRMNQLDEAKKIIRRAAGDAVQNYEFSMNLAKTMQAHMDEMIPKEPDWDAEFQKDPAKAREMQRYYEKANSFRTQLNNQMTEAAKKQAESNYNQTLAFAEEESQKFEQMNRKNWSDPKKKSKDLQSMRRTALASGFSEEELSQVYDSRMLTVLLKASKYDRMMAARPKPVVRDNVKPIPPGAGSAKQRTVQKGANSAMKRLNRTGSVEDAAVVFDHIIARQG